MPDTWKDGFLAIPPVTTVIVGAKTSTCTFTVTLFSIHAYFLFDGLYAPREYGTLPLLSVERLVIVRLGKAQQRTAPSGGVPRAIP